MKIIMTVLLLIQYTILSYGQEATSLRIFDTRDIVDQPSFLKRSIRVDFKNRATIGVPGVGMYSTNITIAPWLDASGGLNHQLNFNNGGIYYRQGNFNQSSWQSWQKVLLENADGNVGIGTTSPQYKLDVNGIVGSKGLFLKTTSYASSGWATSELMYSGHTLRVSAPQGSNMHNVISFYPGTYNGSDTRFTSFEMYTSNSLTNYTKKVQIHSVGDTYFNGGNVGIGTTTPKNKLDVVGTIRATEVKVETGWADFVFDKDYKLPSLEEVESHINEYKRLPDIPSEAQVKEEGVGLGEMQVKLLQKIEELTLYIIKQEKRIDELENTR